MTTHRTDRLSDPVRPPRGAEAVLRLLLRRDDVESVSGDLLEEYRESVYPSRERWRADVWYVRQMIGFVARMPLMWGLVFAVCMAGRDLLDTFAPPVNWGPRSAVTTWSAIALFVLVGAWGGWRTGRARTGPLVAMIVLVIASTLHTAFAIALYIAVIRHDPVKLYMFQMTGGLGEIGFPSTPVSNVIWWSATLAKKFFSPSANSSNLGPPVRSPS